MKIKAILALLLACSGCRTTASVQSAGIEDLLANPEAHQGQIVRIRGAVVARLEAAYICSNLEQIDSARSHECLWLKPGLVGEGLGPGEISQLHKKWVDLTGRFDSTFTGHMGAYGGSVIPITVKVVGGHDKGDIPSVLSPQSRNSAFKPNLHRYAVHMAGRACHVASYALQCGSTQAFGADQACRNL